MEPARALEDLVVLGVADTSVLSLSFRFRILFTFSFWRPLERSSCNRTYGLFWILCYVRDLILEILIGAGFSLCLFG